MQINLHTFFCFSVINPSSFGVAPSTFGVATKKQRPISIFRDNVHKRMHCDSTLIFFLTFRTGGTKKTQTFVCVCVCACLTPMSQIDGCSRHVRISVSNSSWAVKYENKLRPCKIVRGVYFLCLTGESKMCAAQSKFFIANPHLLLSP